MHLLSLPRCTEVIGAHTRAAQQTEGWSKIESSYPKVMSKLLLSLNEK